MRKWAAGLAVTSTLVTGCEMAAPQTDTMALLRSGDPKVCGTADVEQTLKEMVLPTASDLPNDLTEGQKEYLLEEILVTLDHTRLESVDKSVSKASCVTTMKFHDREWNVTFEISPSSQDEGNYIISANGVGYVKMGLEMFLSEGVARIQAENEREMAQEAEAAAWKLVQETVSREWLVGRWIKDDKLALACAEGPYLEFASSGKFSSPEATGTWKLEEQSVTLAVTDGAPGQLGYTASFTQADMDSFTQARDDAEPVSMRRCSPEEIAAAPASDPFESAQAPRFKLEPSDTNGL